MVKFDIYIFISFIHKYFSGHLSKTLDDSADISHFLAQGEVIGTLYTEKKFHAVTKTIIMLADLANQYVDQKKPWQMIKESDQVEDVHVVCTTALHLFWIVSVYLHPIIPETTSKIFSICHQKVSSMSDAGQQFTGKAIQPFPRILERITLDMCPTA